MGRIRPDREAIPAPPNQPLGQDLRQGDVHTQTIEGFFGLFKTGVRGAHHSVSHKWLQGYLNEWTWRYNRREDGNKMFRDLVGEAVKTVR